PVSSTVPGRSLVPAPTTTSLSMTTPAPTTTSSASCASPCTAALLAISCATAMSGSAAVHEGEFGLGGYLVAHQRSRPYLAQSTTEQQDGARQSQHVARHHLAAELGALDGCQVA